MSMRAMIKPEIWSDSDFHALDPAGKLAFFWLLTNDTRNNVGLSKADKARFEFDTGLPYDSLSSLEPTLSSSTAFLKDRNTLLVLCLNFIKHNLSMSQINVKVPIGRSVITEASALPGVLRDALCSKYPRLADTLRDIAANPRLEQPPVQGSAVQGSTVSSSQSGAGGAHMPSDDEVIEFGAAYPGDMARGVPVMDPEWVSAWLARMCARSGEWPVQWQRAIVSAWRSDWRMWGQKNAGKNGGALVVRQDGTWGLKQRLEELRHEANTHPGNRGASAYVPDGPQELEDEYEKLCAQIRELEEKMRAAT
jgi:hypothetical protein